MDFSINKMTILIEINVLIESSYLKKNLNSKLTFFN